MADAVETVLGEHVKTDRRRAHRCRRARPGPGGEPRSHPTSRRRAGRAWCVAERGAAARRGGRRGGAAPPRASTREATPARARYCYRVLARAAPSPFERDRALWWPRAARRGSSAPDVPPPCCRARTTSPPSPHRRPSMCASSATCCGAQWRREGDVLEFWIEADTFMRHMVRVLVGTMLEVGAGRRGDGRLRAAAGGRTALRGRADRRAARPLSGLGALRVERSESLRAPRLTFESLDEGPAHERRRHSGQRPARDAAGAARSCPDVELAVIAPDANRSASARSITTRVPLWVEEVDFDDGTTGSRPTVRPSTASASPSLGLVEFEPRADRLGHQPRRQPR